MPEIDDICREIIRKRSAQWRGGYPYGANLSFDDLWEGDKDHLRDTVRNAIDVFRRCEQRI